MDMTGTGCTVNAGVPTSYCSNERIVLEGATSTLNSKLETIEWCISSVPTGADISIVNPFQPQSELSGSFVPGDYEFVLSMECSDGMITSNCVTHTILAPPTEPDAGPDISFECYTGGGIDITLGNLPGAGESAMVSVAIGTSGTLTGSGLDYTFFPTPRPDECYGTNKYGTQISYTFINDAGCKITDVMDIEYYFVPETCYATSLPSGCFTGDAPYCARIDAACSLNGMGTWSVVPGSGPSPEAEALVTFNDPNDPHTFACVMEEGTYTYQWDIVGGCNSNCHAETTTVYRGFGSGAIIPYAGPDRTFCPTIPDIIALNGSSLGPGQIGTWTQIEGPMVTIQEPNNPSTTVSGFESGAGPWEFRWLVQGDACSLYDEMKIIEVPEITVSAPSRNYNCSDYFGTVGDVILGFGPDIRTTIDYWDAIIDEIEVTLLSGPEDFVNTNSNIEFKPWFSANCGASGGSPFFLSLGETHSYDLPSTSGCNQGRPQLRWLPEYPGEYEFSYKVTTQCQTITRTQKVKFGGPTSGGLPNAGTNVVLPCGLNQFMLTGIASAEARWDLVSSIPPGLPDMLTSSDVSDPTSRFRSNPTLMDLQDGIYTFRYSVIVGPNCDPIYDEVTVQVSMTSPENLNVTNETQVICASGPVILSASYDGASEENVTWSLNPASSGTNFTFSPADPIGNDRITITDLDPNTEYTFDFVAENGCGITTESVTFTTGSDEGPSLAIIDGEDICSDSGMETLTADPLLNGTTGNWSFGSIPIGASPMFSSTNSTTTEVTGLTTDGTYEIIWSTTNLPCPTVLHDTLLISVGEIQESMADNFIINCNAEIPLTDNLIANEITVGKGNWFQAAGPALADIDDIYDFNSEVVFNASGEYKFGWSSVLPGCGGDTSYMTFRIGKPAPPAFAGLDQVICSGNGEFNLQALDIPDENSGYWLVTEVSPGLEVNLSSTDTESTIATFSQPGQATLRWTVLPEYLNCSSKFSEIDLTWIQSNIVSDVDNFCDNGGTPVSFELSGTPLDIEGATVMWTGSTGMILNSNTSNAVVTGVVGAGTYTYTYDVRYDYTYDHDNDIATPEIADFCVSSSDVNVTIDEYIQAEVMADEVCAGSNFILNGNDISATNPNAMYQWSIIEEGTMGTLSDSDMPTASYASAQLGETYVFQYRIDNGACRSLASVEGMAVACPCVIEVNLVEIETCSNSLIPEIQNGEYYNIVFEIVGIENPVEPFELVLNANLDGTGGTVLMSGLTIGEHTLSSTALSLVFGETYDLSIRSEDITADCLGSFMVQTEIPISCTSSELMPVSCLGGSDGALVINAIGGSGQYQYSIDGLNWQNTNVFENLNAGNYLVTVRDFQSTTCISNCTVTITEPTEALSFSLTKTDVDCFEGSTGTISVTAMGGTAPYEYSLDGGPWQPGSEFNGLEASGHTIQVRDARGCLEEDQITISEPNLLSCSVIGTDLNSCSASNGTLSVSVMGGTAPYEYSIDGTTYQMSNEFNSLSSGLYVVRVVDSKGCSTNCEYRLEAPDAPSCEIVDLVHINCAGSSTGSFSVTGFGGSSTDYEFSLNGAPYSSASSFNNLPAGVHTVRVRIANTTGCESICSVEIEEPFGLTCSLNKIDVSCLNGSDGVILVSSTGGSGSYEYRLGSGSFQNSNEFEGLEEGSYTITVRDANATGCMTTCTISLSEPTSLPSVTGTAETVSCFGNNDGVVEVSGSGGTAPYEYNIDGGPWQMGTRFTGLSSGDHTIGIRDFEGCESNSVLNVPSPEELICSNIIGTDPTDCSTNDGQINVTAIGGVSPLMYSIDGSTFQSSNVFSNLSSGSYTVIIEDANGCETNCSVALTSPNAPLCFIPSFQDVSCHGGTDGSITVQGIGGSGNYEYNIDDGPFGSNNTFTNLSAGLHVVSVRNAGTTECISICTQFLEEPRALMTFVEVESLSCLGNGDGQIEVSASGGSGSFEYQLNNGSFQISNIFTGLSANVYSVTVRDINVPSCSTTISAIVEEPEELLIESVVVVNEECSIRQDGSISVLVSGGTTDYEYSLNGGAWQSGSLFENLVADDYTILVRDKNGCTVSTSTSVELVNCIFDLALEKFVSTSTSMPIVPGALVDFTIEVWNQGNIPAYNISIVDYPPSGLILSDPNWTQNPVSGIIISNNDINQINPGEKESINISFIVDENLMLDQLVNYAEIFSADDDNNPNNGVASDEDSTPFDNQGDDELIYDGQLVDSDNGFFIDDDLDSDDYDPALISIMQEFDLALKKEYAYHIESDGNNMINPGEEVVFKITVYNQGTLNATNIEVTDYVPSNMIFTVGGVDNDFTGSGIMPTATIASLGSGQSADLYIRLRVDPSYMWGQQINNAEITSGENALGLEDEDDPLGVVHGSIDDDSEMNSDNDIDDEMNFPVGSMQDNPADADDYDLAIIEIGQMFDLALDKVLNGYNDLNGDGVMSPGDEVTFLLTVYNQGTLDAYNIQVSDYIPEGLILNDSNWNNFQNVSIAQLNTVIPYLPASPTSYPTVTRTITFTIDETFRGNSIVNWAEISAADDDDDNVYDPPMEFDSTPDAIQGNDSYGGDNVTDNSNNDEDDHDPAEINPVVELDLALTKKDQNSDPIGSWGEIRTFDIEVTNQGTIYVTEFTVSDYIPCGYEFVQAPGQNPGWIYNPITRIASFEYDEDRLNVNESVTLNIELKVVDCDSDVYYNWTNYAEITAYDDDYNDFNTEIQDVDSDPDMTNFDDPGGEPWGPSDDYIDGDGTGPFGGGPASGDEDDHDPAKPELFDLALIKQLKTINDPYRYGDLLEFEITVCNQGNIGAQNVQVADYLPTGYNFAFANNSAWGGTSTAPVYTIPSIAINDCEKFSIYLTIEQTSGGEKDWVNYAEIVYAENENGIDRTTWDIDSNPGSDNPEENAVEPSHPEQGDDDLTSTDKGGEEDDHDPAGIELLDLAVRKVTTNQTGPFVYGDVITYTFEVYNQGSIQTSGIELTDYIPCGFKYLSSNNGSGWSYDSNTSMATYLIAGPLVPGGSTTVTIELALQQCLDTSDESFTNYVEISNHQSDDPDYPNQEDVDSMTDNDPNNDMGGTPDDPNEDNVINEDKYDGGDEDDHDPERVELFDLALKKELITVNDPYRYGDLLEFKITVCNQGNVDAANIVVSDYLPAGYSFAFANNPGWGGTTSSPTYEIPGILRQDACTELFISLTLEMTAGGEKDWFNYAEITSSTDTNGNPRTDGDSTEGSNSDNENLVEPGELGDDDLTSVEPNGNQDDHDPAGIEVFDLAQIKTTTATGPFKYGDIVTFDLTLFNQGSIEAKDIELTDYIPCGYRYSNTNDSNGWSYDAATGYAMKVITGPLAPGEHTMVSIVLQVQECYENVENAWTNISEISGSESNDPDSPANDIDSNSDMDPNNDPGGEPNSPDDNELHGDGDCGDCIQRVCVPLNNETPAIVESVYVDGSILVLPNYPYDLNDPAQAAQFLADCLALGYSIVENFDPVTQILCIDVLYPGENFESYNFNNGEEYYFTCHDCNTVSDEDDHDPEVIDIFDLALRKTVDDLGPYDEGEIVEYHIDVFNQGNVAAYDVLVTDYLNHGYLFDASANAGWAQTGDLVQTTVPGPIAPGDSVRLTLNLEIFIPDGAHQHSWYNEAEISGANDENGDPRNDADSYPDTNPDNDNPLGDGPDDDNILNGDGNDNVIDEDINDPFNEGDDDEDDNDAAEVIVVGGLGDTVFKDLDGDGIRDVNEPGVQGVIVTLTDCMGTVLETQVTDANGFYFFENLVPGDYQVFYDISNLPVGCAFTYQDVGNDDSVDSDVDLSGVAPCTHIDGGEYDSSFDAGLLILASLGDFVWHDLDGDGQQDANEPGLAGVTVNLYDGDGNFLETTTTDSNGYYLFDLLYPGDYYVQFITPDGMELTFANTGVNDGLDSDVDGSNGPGTTSITHLDAGENDLDWDAGYYFCVPIGDLVWYDNDEDDVWDDVENGINGLDVNLWKNHFGTWVIWDTAETGHKPGTPSDDGYFKFCAPPGQYYIEVLMPPYGLVPAQPNRGNNEERDSDIDNSYGFGTSDDFVVFSGQEKCDLGAGYYPMAQIGDRVWRDDNENGMQDPSEPAMSGVTVQAYNVLGEMVAETTTATDGTYNIDYLQQEDYYLRFTPPAGSNLGITYPNMGDDMMDSDVDHSNGPNTTPFYSMSPGMEVPHVDAGLTYATVVPVEWLSFTGEHRGNHNQLDWSTATEFNSSHFEVLRRHESETDFRLIGKVVSEGTTTEITNYEMQDYDVAQSGIYYYRLKQVDYDGGYDYSETIAIRVAGDASANTVSIYPNPAIDDVNVDMSISQLSEVKISIWDANGKVVRDNVFMAQLEAGEHTRTIDISGLSAGVYQLKLKIGRETINQKLIVLKK